MSSSEFAILAAIVCCVSQCYAGNAVPVFLWGGNESTSSPKEVNPFSKTSRSEFESILQERFANSQPPIIVFVKENLCVEDVMRHKQEFKQFHRELSYFPAVDSPLSAFNNLPLYNRSLQDDLDSISEGQLVMVNVTDLDGVFKKYSKYRDSSVGLVTALTGKSCGYSRSERTRRAAVEDKTPFIVNTNEVLMYCKEYPYLKTPENDEYVQLTNRTVSSINGDGTAMSPINMTVSFKYLETKTVRLYFYFEVLSVGYYTLRTIDYQLNGSNKTALSTNAQIVFPFNFSYHCSQNTVFRKDTIVLNITNLQVQLNAKNSMFSDSYDCVGFTSIPIWSGIFVTAILASIMIWALSMIIDIRTMDRFDDPKGKTITISAQE